MNRWIIFFVFIFYVLLIALFAVRPAHAAGGVTPNANVSATNPLGYSASVNNGAVQVGTQMVVYSPPPPVGAPVSAGLTAAVTGVGGLAALAPDGTFSAIMNNPAAAISAASSFMMAGGMAAAPFNPLLGGGLAAAGLVLQGGLTTCNVVGCSFLDGLKNQGITLNPDGSAVLTVQNSPSGVPVSISMRGLFYNHNWSGHLTTETYETAQLACNARFLSTYPNVDAVDTLSILTTGGDMWVCNPQKQPYYGTYVGVVNAAAATLYCPTNSTLNGSTCACASGYEAASNGLSCVLAPPATTTTAASTAQIVAAITAASVAASFKADMINLGLKNGMPMVADAITAQQVNVASVLRELSSSTDALGNVTQILARNVTSVVPGATTADAPTVINKTETVTVTNSVPTGMNTVVGSTTAGATTQQATKDLCVDHPDILACADLSRLGDLPVVTPLTDTKNIGTLSPVAVGVGFAICPAPIVLSGLMGGPPMYLDVWKYPCQFAGYIKPINIIAASIASIYILMGAFKNG